MTTMPSDWRVPAFETHALTPRVHRHALVIPVINEGARIRAQLERLHALALPVDVIVADGGSTDGSLDPDFLRKTGVRALLVKRGPGRLSAQLRMAYAYALTEGYAGIVTVDGNGKDGLDAIPRFVEKLEEGYGLVQGSRYVPGGVAVNTPTDRWIGGRFVHAPIVSLGARFRYTDTTNGFRGYSAEALRDPRVAPFRDIFMDYNLLFYLSVRIPRLGYRVCEVPVERRYPPTGKTPTKISGLSGRLAMIGEVVKAAAGRLDPAGR